MKNGIYYCLIWKKKRNRDDFSFLFGGWVLQLLSFYWAMAFTYQYQHLKISMDRLILQNIKYLRSQITQLHLQQLIQMTMQAKILNSLLKMKKIY